MPDAMMMAPSISQESMSLVPRRRLLEEFLTALRKVSPCTACRLFLHLRLPAPQAACTWQLAAKQRMVSPDAACSSRCQFGGLPGILVVTAAELQARLWSLPCCCSVARAAANFPCSLTDLDFWHQSQASTQTALCGPAPLAQDVGTTLKQPVLLLHPHPAQAGLLLQAADLSTERA